MSGRPKLNIVPADPHDEWIRQLADLIDGDQWTTADLLLERYPVDEYSGEGTSHTGLFLALASDSHALADRYGIVAKVAHLASMRSTAIAWPDSARALSASFAVHLRMRGKDRVVEMARRLKQAEREGKSALTVLALARYRAEDNPKKVRQYDERMRQAIAAAVRREMLGGIITTQPDWWMAETVGDADREVAVRELRRLANAINAGVG